MAPTVTPALRKCLHVIGQISGGDGLVTTAQVARCLRISQPSATGLFRRLQTLDLVRYQRYRGAELTDSGRSLVQAIERRQHLLQQLLIRTLALSTGDALAEAGRLEPGVSNQLEARIVALLAERGDGESSTYS